jgi:uncharacterized protein
MPSEYYPEVFGGEISDTCEFDSLNEANEFLALRMRHWNDISGTLFRDEVYAPLLIEDKDGIPQGNDWAQGFMRGIGMRNEGWAELINYEEYGGSLLPMMVLCHEHDQDPEMRPDPISPEKREEIIVMMAGDFWERTDTFGSTHSQQDRGVMFTRLGETIHVPAAPERSSNGAAAERPSTDSFVASSRSVRRDRRTHRTDPPLIKRASPQHPERESRNSPTLWCKR